MKKITLILFALAVSANVYSQEIVAYWNQNSNDLPGGGFGFLADPSVFPQAADLGDGFLTIGGGLLSETTTNANDDVIYTWILSFGGSDINVENEDEAGGSISIQGGTDNGNNGSYLQFEISMEEKSNLEISYATRGTASGFSTQTWSWSTDGVDFTDFETIEDTNVTDFYLVETSVPSDVDGEETVFLRVTLDGASTTNGNNRFDNIKFVAEDGLNTNDFQQSAFSMYPNPAKDIVTITTNSNLEMVVNVYDILGKRVLSQTNNTLDVSRLKSGVYMVQVAQGNNTSVQKLIVR
ncbi:MAG TPA: T9SS type A sorting domain-containing protein [Flavobacteriaceae bacterium]|nr:T9SS type A sorting domain-containing protein [Flavobacteriaceae bacterium]